MPLTKDNFEDAVRYHRPSEDQISRIMQIRDASFVMLSAIMENCPACDDTTAATRKVREAMMTANAAIALNGMV